MDNPRNSILSDRSSIHSKRTSQIHPSSSSTRNSQTFSSAPDNRSSIASSTTSTTTTANTQQNRLVLITGATGAIGRATAVAFARTGHYNLALHYNAAGEEQRERLITAINDVVPAVIDVALFQADLSRYDDVRALHGEVVEAFGTGVDILFNNAGTTAGIQHATSLASVPISVFETTWRVNAGAAMLLTQLSLPHMEARGWGRIVFNSSVAAFEGGSVGPHDAAAKAALHGFVYWVGASVAGKGVTVNAVAPAGVGGEGVGVGMGMGMERRLPVARSGRPEEVAETVLFMVNNGFLTRKILPVDGGFHPH